MSRKIVFISLAMLMLIILSCQAKTTPKDKQKPKPIVTFVELGSNNCIPCKMMKPVMTAVEDKYQEKVKVIFHDVNKDRQKASEYKIRVIPTQVFLNIEGKEIFRHEGFYPKEEIFQLLDKELSKSPKK